MDDSGQIVATSHDPVPPIGKGISRLFQGNPVHLARMIQRIIGKMVVPLGWGLSIINPISYTPYPWTPTTHGKRKVLKPPKYGLQLITPKNGGFGGAHGIYSGYHIKGTQHFFLHTKGAWRAGGIQRACSGFNYRGCRGVGGGEMLGGCEDVCTWNLLDLYCGA